MEGVIEKENFIISHSFLVMKIFELESQRISINPYSLSVR